MKKTNLKSILSFIVCMVLIAAIALFTIGCNDKSNASEPSLQTHSQNDVRELGNGKSKVSFTAVGLDGKESNFIIKTDKKTVGEALMEHGLISGEEGPYGLYVKTVNGITLDFDKDGKYWAFYIDGNYATTGVEKTEISDTAKYYFKAE